MARCRNAGVSKLLACEHFATWKIDLLLLQYQKAFFLFLAVVLFDRQTSRMEKS